MDTQTLVALNQANSNSQKPWGYVNYPSQSLSGGTGTPGWISFSYGNTGSSSYGMGWNSLGLTIGTTGIYFVYFTMTDTGIGNTFLGGGLLFGENLTSSSTPLMINCAYPGTAASGLSLTGTWIGLISAGTAVQLAGFTIVDFSCSATLTSVYIGPQ